jgi:Lrp/AsnC family leucine-responsive transcriptional regulator
MTRNLRPVIIFLKGCSTVRPLPGRGFPCYPSGMTAFSPDATDWRILDVLQREGRASFAELARAVSMSPSAVTERVRRMEEAGVIQGYAAVVDPERLGLPILAFVRLRYPNGNYKPFHDLVAVTPEILEAHHVTGDDCFVIKVAARSMRHLEEVSGRIGTLGSVTTSVVYSSPLPRRPLGQ